MNLLFYGDLQQTQDRLPSRLLAREPSGSLKAGYVQSECSRTVGLHCIMAGIGMQGRGGKLICSVIIMMHAFPAHWWHSKQTAVSLDHFLACKSFVAESGLSLWQTANSNCSHNADIECLP